MLHRISRMLASTLVVLSMLVCSCSEEQEHVAAAVDGADSLRFMNALGISTLISDSGVIRYKLIAEEWQIHRTTPVTWKFYHGFFMERFDENMHTDLYVQADTAYLHEQRMWELRGRVVVKNLQGTLFLTQELYWDMNEHRMWNHVPMDIYTPDRELHGTDFRSNEQMTDYFVTNSVGSFPMSDADSAPSPEEAAANTQPTTPGSDSQSARDSIKEKTK